MKTLLLISLMFVCVFAGLAQTQQGVNVNGWELSNSPFPGKIDSSSTFLSKEDNGMVQNFISFGTPMDGKPYPNILQVVWLKNFSNSSVPDYVSGELRLDSSMNLDSLEVFISIQAPNGNWSMNMKKTVFTPGDSGKWKMVVWNMSGMGVIGSFNQFRFSFQFRTGNLLEIGGGVSMRNLKKITGTDTVAIDSSLVTDVVTSRNVKTPSGFELDQNYPNPFNPSTKIQFSVPKRGQIRLVVFNSLGQEIMTLVNGEKNTGSYEVNFNASNLPSGVYFYRLQAGSSVEVKKMVLLK